MESGLAGLGEDYDIGQSEPPTLNQSESRIYPVKGKIVHWAVTGLNAVLSALLFSVPASAVAQSRAMHTLWMIQPATGTPVEQSVRGEDWVFKQRVLPSGLFRVDAAVSDGTVGTNYFLSGTQLIEVTADGAVVACDAVARRQKILGASQFCLIDYDKDARFDGIFPVSNISKGGGLLTVQGRYPKNAKPIQPVAYSRIQPADLEGQYFVGIKFVGKAALYDRLNFQVCYGSDIADNCLSDILRTSASSLPASLGVLGSELTILSREGGSTKIRVDKMMPPQPFGIMATTTYTIY